MHKLKLFKVFTAALELALLSAGITCTSFAGEWKEDSTGWWYDNGDGTYQNNGWFQDNDGKYYYFGSDGYMYKNRFTPGGYYVNESGEWVPGISATDESTRQQSRDEVLHYLQAKESAPLYYFESDITGNGISEVIVKSPYSNLQPSDSSCVLQWRNGEYQIVHLPSVTELDQEASLLDTGLIDICGGMEFYRYHYGYRLNEDGTWTTVYKGEIMDDASDTGSNSGNFLNGQKLNSNPFPTESYLQALENYGHAIPFDEYEEVP